MALVYAILAMAGCQMSSAREFQQANRLEQSGDGPGACTARRRAAEAMRREGNSYHETEAAAANSYCLSQGID
jgi:hypothetical protein